MIQDKNYDEENTWRTCIGRAYYAAFLYTKNKLEQLGFNFPDDHNVHTAVGNALMDSDRRIGTKLNSLKLKRGDSDYHLDVPISKDLARHFVGVSERVIYDVDSLRRKN